MGSASCAPVDVCTPVTAPESDEALVNKALAGKTEAFDQLLLRYQDRVFNILARICPSTQEAEDLAQETFLKAYRALNSFRQGSKFYTWLFRIAVNTGLSARRQNARRRAHEGVSLDAPAGDSGEHGRNGYAQAPASPDSDPARRFEKDALRLRVLEGLRQLEPDYRAILILRDLEGMDYDCIGETLSISRAAVKSRLHRARMELARMLKDLRP